MWPFETTARTGGIALGVGLELTTSLGLGLDRGLEFVTRVGKGEPEAIASCFASKPCRLSFNSRPRPRSSSSLPHNQKSEQFYTQASKCTERNAQAYRDCPHMIKHNTVTNALHHIKQIYAYAKNKLCLYKGNLEGTNPVVVSICINFFWLERQRLTRSTIISSLTA